MSGRSLRRCYVTAQKCHDICGNSIVFFLSPLGKGERIKVRGSIQGQCASPSPFPLPRKRRRGERKITIQTHDE